MTQSNRRLTRRRFIQSTAAGAAAATVFPMSAASYGRIIGANARLQIAFVATGGIASGEHIGNFAKLGIGCPCFADVDRNRWSAATSRWSDAAGYTDYRRMFDKHANDIDAVMIGTPDHHHYPATILAMMLGKHVYTQKPLTHTVWEARQLAKAQREYKLATQMGNQGHQLESLRLTIDYLRGGAIGKLKEAHIWTDRPWWRQAKKRPAGAEPVPDHFDWDAWLGPAPMRPFRHQPADNWGGLYHPFNWRGWWDFGTGALGDMACHEVDPVYWAMLPGAPKSIEVINAEPIGDGEMYPKGCTVKFEFGAKGDRPGFALYWYEGGRRPERPEELAEGEDLSNQGALYIGTDAKMIAMPHARAEPRLLPDAYHKEHGKPEPQIERSKDGHHREWYLACTGERSFDHPKSNFAYAAPFTETMLLGCIAQKVGGRLEYDAAAMRFTNSDEANALITKEYREGWDFRMG